MSPRLPSTITSSSADRAYAQTSASAPIPSAPSASKKASWGLTATAYGATASTMPRQKRATASAGGSPRSSTGKRSTRGSSPTQSWLRLRSTAAASRSENAAVTLPASARRSCAIGTPSVSSTADGCGTRDGRDRATARPRGPAGRASRGVGRGSHARAAAGRGPARPRRRPPQRVSVEPDPYPRGGGAPRARDPALARRPRVPDDRLPLRDRPVGPDLRRPPRRPDRRPRARAQPRDGRDLPDGRLPARAADRRRAALARLRARQSRSGRRLRPGPRAPRAPGARDERVPRQAPARGGAEKERAASRAALSEPALRVASGP